MKSLFLAFALTLIGSLAGCQAGGTLSNSQSNQIETACAASSAALKVLTVANDAKKLSAETQANVLKAAMTIQPVCGSPTPPTLDSLKLQAFMQAAALLGVQAVAAQSKGN